MWLRVFRDSMVKVVEMFIGEMKIFLLGVEIIRCLYKLKVKLILFGVKFR